MQQAHYRQDLNHRYLVVSSKMEKQDYRVSMLMHQKIPQLLPCMVRRVNGELLFSYEVSGKKTLEQMYESRLMKAEEIQKLLLAISETLEQMREYLLNMDMLLLQPAYIFIEESTGGYQFCCYPRAEQETNREFHELCGYILSILEHKEEQAVWLGYSLYRETMEECFSLPGILNQFHKQSGIWKESDVRTDYQQTENNAEQFLQGAIDEQKEKRPRELAGEWREKMPRRPAGEQKEKTLRELSDEKKEKEPRRSAGEQKKKGSYRSSDEQKGKLHRDVAGSSEELLLSEEKTDKKKRSESSKWFFKGKKEQKKYAFSDPIPAYAMEDTFSYGDEGCRLQSVEQPKLLFAPSKFPFLIGSLEYAVDGYVNDPGVSHFHARLEKEDTIYYLTDLHSIQGTFVNGNQLAPEVRCPLKQKDRIVFGTSSFVFLMPDVTG